MQRIRHFICIYSNKAGVDRSRPGPEAVRFTISQLRKNLFNMLPITCTKTQYMYIIYNLWVLC